MRVRGHVCRSISTMRSLFRAVAVLAFIFMSLHFSPDVGWRAVALGLRHFPKMALQSAQAAALAQPREQTAGEEQARLGLREPAHHQRLGRLTEQPDPPLSRQHWQNLAAPDRVKLRRVELWRARAH